MHTICWKTLLSQIFSFSSESHFGKNMFSTSSQTSLQIYFSKSDFQKVELFQNFNLAKETPKEKYLYKCSFFNIFFNISDCYLPEINSWQFSSRLSIVAIIYKINDMHRKIVFHLVKTLSNYFILLYQIYSVRLNLMKYVIWNF